MGKLIKLILFLCMLLVSSAFVSAYADVTFKFDQNSVSSLSYNCLDANCNTVAPFSGSYSNGKNSTTNGNLTIVFPSTLQSQYGYAIYFFSEGFVPKSYLTTFNTNGDNKNYNATYSVSAFNKVKDC